MTYPNGDLVSYVPTICLRGPGASQPPSGSIAERLLKQR